MRLVQNAWALRGASRHIETQRLYQRFYRFTHAVSRPFLSHCWWCLLHTDSCWSSHSVSIRCSGRTHMFDHVWLFDIQNSVLSRCEADLLFCFTLIHICMCTDTLYISLSSSWPREQARWSVRKCKTPWFFRSRRWRASASSKCWNAQGPKIQKKVMTVVTCFF
jgi:hypothetical protein